MDRGRRPATPNPCFRILSQTQFFW
jgi:hypothetical protein